jgi:hypothetical protein
MVIQKPTLILFLAVEICLILNLVTIFSIQASKDIDMGFQIAVQVLAIALVGVMFYMILKLQPQNNGGMAQTVKPPQ